MKVSVIITAYNHAKFIFAALDGAARQQTAFDVEVLVGDDCSSDGTRAIIEDFAARFPARIKPVYREQNIGGGRNFTDLYHRCSGQYISLLDGDDYWSDPEKLQRQVEAMDANPAWTISHHPVQRLYEPGRLDPTPFPPHSPRPYTTFEELAWRNNIATCSAMYRSKVVEHLPAWFLKLALGDWPLHLLHAVRGEIGYLDRVMGVYRIHPSGAWALRPLGWQSEKEADMFWEVRRSVPRRYAGLIARIARHYYFHSATAYFEAGDTTNAKRVARRLAGLGFSSFRDAWFLGRILARTHAPFISKATECVMPSRIVQWLNYRPTGPQET